MRNKAQSNILLLTFVLLTKITLAQTYYGINPDTVKAQKFDMGKMWTFENPPLDYFEKEYRCVDVYKRQILLLM